MKLVSKELGTMHVRILFSQGGMAKFRGARRSRAFVGARSFLPEVRECIRDTKPGTNTRRVPRSFLHLVNSHGAIAPRAVADDGGDGGGQP